MSTEREMDRAEYDALLTSLNGGGASTPDLHTFQRAWEFDSNFVWRISEGHTHNALEAALDEIERLKPEVERLTEANDRLAKIASSVAVTLEAGKRDLMAHGWDAGRKACDDWWVAPAGVPTPTNPYREAVS